MATLATARINVSIGQIEIDYLEPKRRLIEIPPKVKVISDSTIARNRNETDDDDDQ